MPDTSTDWRMSTWEQFNRKGHWGAGDSWVSIETALCPGSQEGKLHFGVHSTHNSLPVKRGDSLTIFSTISVSPCVQFGASQYKKDITLRAFERRIKMLVTGLEDMSCEERVRKDTWVVQCGEKEVKRWPHYSLQVLEERKVRGKC